MKEDGIYEKFMKSLSSQLEIGIAVDFMRDISKNGILVNDQAYYARIYETSRQTVSKVFTKAKKVGLFKSAGRDIYVNPYVVLPYGSNDANNHFLQRRWEKIWTISESNGGTVSKSEIDKLTINLRADIEMFS